MVNGRCMVVVVEAFGDCYSFGLVALFDPQYRQDFVNYYLGYAS